MDARDPLIRPVIGFVLVGVVALTSCAAQQEGAGSDGAEVETTSQAELESAGPPPTSEMLTAEVDEPIAFEQCLEAEAMDGAVVEWLGDVVIEEREVRPVQPTSLEVDGEEIKVPGAPGILIPERVAQGGCVIEYPAPSGCLPAVEISGSFIPGYRIPQRVAEEVHLPDGTVVAGARQPALESQAVEQDGVFQGEVCQIEPANAQDGDRVAYVRRPYIRRPYIRASYQRNTFVNRPSVRTESGDLVSLDNFPSYTVASVTVSSATISSATLSSYRIEGAEHTEYSNRDDATAYTTEGDVLFDSDDHQLRPQAESELQAIAGEIAQRDEALTVRVEGHTDDVPTEAYADNIELSKRRAESVVKWLQENTDVADEEITSEGMGAQYPRADNASDKGRQQNRRVVITVIPQDYNPEIDYEVDDSAGGD